MKKQEKMKRPYLVLIVLLFQSCLLLAQQDVVVSRKEFKTAQPGFDMAWKHIKDGNSFFSKRGIWYSRALEEYKVAYVYNKLNPELNYLIGVSALYSDSKEQAAEYLTSAFSLNNEVT
jgi:hypothetical protein